MDELHRERHALPVRGDALNGSGHVGQRYPRAVANDAARDAIVGLWRLVAYEDREHDTQAWTRTDGQQPRGVAVYHSSGMLSVQLFGAPGSDSAAYHVGYLGTFSVREAVPDGDGFSGVVEHRMESVSDPALLALDVAREFSVSGDRLTLSDGHVWRRTFERMQ
jgi:hypothetical protein